MSEIRRRVPPPAEVPIKDAEEKPKPVKVQRGKSEMFDWIFLTVVAIMTRWYGIGRANYVIWDEAHFAKFANYYLTNRFYTDLHPNLGKGLLGLSGWLAGSPGHKTFEFKSEQTYPPEIPYVWMRRFCAFFGALMVPLAYGTGKAMGMTRRGAWFAGLLVLFDNGLLTITRFILLDALLLFFTALSIFTLAKFRTCGDKPFSKNWWLWLTLTGISIGCESGVKWLGFFTVVIVGLWTIIDLWMLMGDKNTSDKDYIKHWMARILCLIILPILVYAGSFYFHFRTLHTSGPGNAQMPTMFQADLTFNDVLDQPNEVVYGSQVVLRSNAPWGGLLHSHVQTYPFGSGQQQVTGYHHSDDNNNFRIERNWDDLRKSKDESWPMKHLVDGEVIRIAHVNTKKNLHSHRVKAPITKARNVNEVSCYGDLDKNSGDKNDHWRIEVVHDDFDGYDEGNKKNSTSRIVRSITTKFRIRHMETGCLLTYDNTLLPKWGFTQYEITCQGDHSSKPSVGKHTWNVEKNINPTLPEPPKGNPEVKAIVPSRISFKEFIKNFFGLQIGMWATNNMLIPDPEKDPDHMTSTPQQWPLASVGMRMCGWSDHLYKYYMLGNPLIWWFGAFSVAALAALTVIYVILDQRGHTKWARADWNNFLFGASLVGVLGWIVHYVPFFIVGRVTYLHHYFPALYFAILSFAFLFDHILRFYTPKDLRAVVWWTVTLVIFAVFYYFSPVSYGMKGPSRDYAGRQWLPGWNIA